MKRLLVGALVTVLTLAGSVVVASAVGVPEADVSAGTFTGQYNFTPASTNSPCPGEDGGTYVYDRISMKGTSNDTTTGDFSLSTLATPPGVMFFVGTMVYNQASLYGWARGTITIQNGTGSSAVKITGPFTAVVGPDASGAPFAFRGLWVGTVRVGGALTGDTTIENFEFNTPNTTSGTYAGSWGGTPSNANLSIKTKSATC